MMVVEGAGVAGDCRRQGACILSKKANRNQIVSGDRDGNQFPEVVWILPFMMLGAMFGSLVGAGIGRELGQLTPFGPALIGLVVGFLVVGAVGLLAIRIAQSG